MAHGFSTELTSVFDNDGKHAEMMKKLLGIDVSCELLEPFQRSLISPKVMVDKNKYDAWICRTCAGKLEALLDFKCKANFASDVYFNMTRDTCDKITATKVTSGINVKSDNALDSPDSTPFVSFSVSIKKEPEDDSSEVSFVSRIPLESIEKLSTVSPDDSIQPQKANKSKKRKLEKTETKEPEHKAKRKGRKSSRRVSCQVCGLEVSQANLKGHMQRVHEKVTTYKCGFCVSSFSSISEYHHHNLFCHKEIFEDFFKRNNAQNLMQDLEETIIHSGTEV